MLVLGAGAVETVGLKTITARHLGQSVYMYIRESTCTAHYTAKVVAEEEKKEGNLDQ